MDLLKLVAKDNAYITSIDFATNILFVSPASPPVSHTVPGYAGKHAIMVDKIGFISVNTKKASITVSEINMLAAGMVTRNEAGDLMAFENYLVSWTDQSGQNKVYKIQANGGQPDENNGIITFIIGYYTA